MNLLIISHTVHFKDSDGTIKGWGPTVREINFLSTKFQHITHLGALHEGPAPDSCLPYLSENIRFIPLPPSGGKTILSKLKSVFKAPEIIKKINAQLENNDALQLRVPTGIANYILPYLTFKSRRPLTWVKYAGNWNQSNAPAGYAFQRWWLKNNFLKCPVTINGSWQNQPVHCHTFENPCLDEHERIEGKKLIAVKEYIPPYTACFIGRMEAEKGVKRIIDALPEFKAQRIHTIHFIGEGKDRHMFQKLADLQKEVKCIFHGSVDRTLIPELLSKSHFILLPSTASEGFPKAIAEGANYGAIPIVSNVSSICQYVNDQNGYIWDSDTDFSSWLKNIDLSPYQLSARSKKGYEWSSLFTYENYFKKLQLLILNDH